MWHHGIEYHTVLGTACENLLLNIIVMQSMVLGHVKFSKMASKTEEQLIFNSCCKSGQQLQAWCDDNRVNITNRYDMHIIMK